MQIPITSYIYEMKEQTITKIIYEGVIYLKEGIDDLKVTIGPTRDKKKKSSAEIGQERNKRGKILVYFKNVPIYEKPYRELKDLYLPNFKTIRNVLSKHIDCAPSTIKTYSTYYKEYLNSGEDPYNKEYETISEKNKQEALDALKEKTLSFDDVLLETNLTPIHLKKTIDILISEGKITKVVKKDGVELYEKKTV
jgi:hypothetical protein